MACAFLSPSYSPPITADLLLPLNQFLSYLHFFWVGVGQGTGMCRSCGGSHSCRVFMTTTAMSYLEDIPV